MSNSTNALKRAWTDKTKSYPSFGVFFESEISWPFRGLFSLFISLLSGVVATIFYFMVIPLTLGFGILWMASGFSVPHLHQNNDMRFEKAGKLFLTFCVELFAACLFFITTPIVLSINLPVRLFITMTHGLKTLIYGPQKVTNPPPPQQQQLPQQHHHGHNDLPVAFERQRQPYQMIFNKLKEENPVNAKKAVDNFKGLDKQDFFETTFKRFAKICKSGIYEDALKFYGKVYTHEHFTSMQDYVQHYDDSGKTLLLHFCRRFRVNETDLRLFRKLIELGSDVDAISEFTDHSALHYAAHRGLYLVVKEILSISKKSINMRAGQAQETPLHMACAFEDLPKLRVMLKWSKIFEALPDTIRSKEQYFRTIQILYTNGADPSLVNACGQIPLNLVNGMHANRCGVDFCSRAHSEEDTNVVSAIFAGKSSHLKRDYPSPRLRVYTVGHTQFFRPLPDDFYEQIAKKLKETKAEGGEASQVVESIQPML